MRRSSVPVLATIALVVGAVAPALGQLVDRTLAPNAANEGIAKSLLDQIGAGRGDVVTPDSSACLIARDPFRAIRRGRQLFQRKFTRAQGQGPVTGDGGGDVQVNLAIGAGLADSCAACHGRPRGSAGFGGDVATRPDSRDAPHLFGLGLKEMLADEMTSDLRAIRTAAMAEAAASGRPVTKALVSKDVAFGSLTAHAGGAVDTSGVEGVDPDLRVRPFFAHGGTVSIREFVVGALNNEMGLQAVDPELYAAAHSGTRITTPAGMVLDGSRDKVEGPLAADAAADPDGDGVTNEVPTSLVDYLEFYLLNYFKPATYEQTHETARGQRILQQIGCTVCHRANLPVARDRRVADVETVYDPERGIFNGLFATASLRHDTVNDGNGPSLKPARRQAFLVTNIFTDLKRHDLGPAFHERDYDGTMRTAFLTTPLWGVGSTAPYGHDGRSISLTEVIRRHGGEAQAARDAFEDLSRPERDALLAFLNSLVIFPPDDTASNLNAGNRAAAGFPQFGHGSIKLSALFNNPADPE
jgi:mono/diheme cytochrome c family protein